MKHLLIITVAILLVSCKGTLMKRKYMDGFFISRTAQMHSKSIDATPTHSTEESAEDVFDVKKQVPNTDTIILASGKRVACKVRMITGQTIVYSSQDSYNKSISTKKVSVIHFNGNKREYFREINEASNPIIQSWMAYTPKQPKKGMAVFGYFMLIVTSAICIALSPVSAIFLLLSVGLLLMMELVDHESKSFRALNGFGKFIGYTYLGLFATGLSILLLILVFSL